MLMKHPTKKFKFILYFCLATFLLNSCTQEKEYLENSNQEFKISHKKFKDLILDNNFNNAYKRLATEKQSKLAARSALEDQFNFTIVESEEVKVIDIDGKTFYNMLIERDTTNASYFENLVFKVEEINNVPEVSAFVLKYETPNGYMQYDPEGEKEFVQLYGRVSGICHNVCSVTCYDIQGNAEYSVPHTPTILCTNSSLIGRYCEWECPPGGTMGGVNNTSGSNTGSGAPNGGGGGSPSNQIVTVPVMGGSVNNNETPYAKITSITNTTEYKNKFNGINTNSNFSATQESGFGEVRSNVTGAVSYVDGIPIPSTIGTDSMNMPLDSYAFTHVHVDDINDYITGIVTLPVKIHSPLDITKIIRQSNIDLAVSSGATPQDIYGIVVSRQGINGVIITDPNIDYTLYRSKYAKSDSIFRAESEKIILNTSNSKKRKERLQILLLKSFLELGINNNVALLEADVKKITLNGVQSTIIKWSKVTLNQDGARIVTPC